MNFKIGTYLERKMKKNHITKVKLHEQLKNIFHKNEEYVSYKGFATRFYTKFYAEDLFEISYLLGIDLNRMRDEIINSKKNNNSELLELALSESKYSEICAGDYSRWFTVEDNKVYIIWFKLMSPDNIDYIIEMYDLKESKMTDITFLTYKAVTELEKGCKDKNLDGKLDAIKVCNKRVYDRLHI